MINAAIDIGSNSILLYIEKDGEKLYDDGEITKLGSELQNTNKLSELSVKKSIEVLKKFINICKKFNTDNIYAVGTMALRAALNSGEFADKVKNETGITIDIITAEEEARLSYLGAADVLQNGDLPKTVIDIGGGSTEFINVVGERIINYKSFNTGILKVTENFFKKEFIDLNYCDSVIGKLSDEFDDWETTNIGSVIGVGGSITNLASVKLGLEIFEPEQINGLLLTDIDIKNLLSLFISVSEKDRENIRGLQRGRASTIIAGSTIALAALRNLNKDCLTVSSKGLRHGLLISKRSS
jgi:exopolyphosphatase/guanosine-5'-triphosphate,3'-diphosphate pyrophosphatase